MIEDERIKRAFASWLTQLRRDAPFLNSRNMVFEEDTPQEFARSFRAFSRTRDWARIAFGSVAFIGGQLFSNFTAEAQSAIPPDLVKLPSGVNTPTGPQFNILYIHQF